ncbi:MAG: CPBP family intramembrane glutamic endopeptidase [Halanaerobiaceae bacterium]
MKNLKIIFKIIGKIFLSLAFSFILAFLIMLPVSSAIQDIGIEITGQYELLISSIVMNIALVLAVIISYKYFEDDFNLGWKQDKSLVKFMEGSIWGIINISIPFIIVLLSGGFIIDNISFDMSVMKNLLFGILLFLMVAIGEELLARGYIMGLVKRHYGAVSAILVSSIIFSFIHILNNNVLQNPIPLITLFLSGILLGLSREVTGGLWVPIGIHFTWNLFQGNILGFEVSGEGLGPSIIEIERTGHQLISGGEFGLEGSLITAVFIILASYIHWWYYKKRSNSC